MEKMNTRQWATYNLIKTNSEKGIQTTQADVCENYSLSTHADGYSWAKGKNTHDRCLQVWKDVHFINASSEVEKIIVMDKFTYRIATEEEAKEYYAKLEEKAVRAFMRAYNVHKKIKANGQGKLISCQGKAIDEESTARRFVEAFQKDF